MATFAELILEYTSRIGIADAELARKIGVRRQTIFRWKEGLVKRPREREVVLDVAKALRLTPEERDALLLAAGFAPESVPDQPSPQIFPQEVVGSVDAETITATESEMSETADELHELDVSLDEPDTSSSSLHSSKAFTGSGFRPASYRSSRGRLFAIGLLLLLALSVLAIMNRVGRQFPTKVSETRTQEPGTTVEPGSDPTEPIKSQVAAQTPSSAWTSCLEIDSSNTLIVVAQFTPLGSTKHAMNRRIVELLQRQTTELQPALDGLMIKRIDQSIDDAAGARSWLTECDATMVIWGEYDDSRVVARITAADDANRAFTKVTSLDDLSTTINYDVPAEMRVLALSALGTIYRSQQKYSEAALAFESALKSSSRSPGIPTDAQRYPLYFRLGQVNYVEGLRSVDLERLNKAIEVYDQADMLAEQLNRRDAMLTYNRGLAYFSRYSLFFFHPDVSDTDLDRAIENLSQSIKWNPQFPEALATRGLAFYRRQHSGDLDKAINDYDRALQLQQTAERYFNRALINIAANERSAWEADLDRAAELNYHPRTVFTAFCYGYLRLIEIELANQSCNQAISRSPTPADSTLANYAIVQARLGNIEEAQKQLSAHLAWLESQPHGYERYFGADVEAWLDQLQVGEMPFTDEMLKNLQ